MGARRIGSMIVGVSLALCAGHVAARAADGAGAAEPGVADHAVADPALEQIRAAVNAEADPELRAAMEEQFHLLETGQLELTDREFGRGAAEGVAGAPADAGVGPRGDDHLPTEARARLEQLFQEEGTGHPALDGEVRAKAAEILKEYGIDPKEFGPGHEGDQERGGVGRGGDEARGREDVGLERAFEQMSPEAREQMERVYQEREMGRGGEGPMHEQDAPMRDFEAPTSDAPAHEYEAPTHDVEAPQPDHDAPQHEYETPAYEAPTQDAHAPEQPEHESQPPQP